jgi:hypothetical protein
MCSGVSGRSDFCRGRCAGSPARFIALNAELAQTWPVIVERTEPLPDADEWNNKPDKLKYLER